MNYVLDPKNFSLQELIFSDIKIKIEAVADIDVLIDQISDDDFNDDERLPYWATLWPSAIGLGHYITSHIDCKRKSVLELGCGLGLNGVICAALGANVIFTDYEEDALQFSKKNVALNELPKQNYELVDWRKPSLAGEFDYIIAADVLYEDRFLEPVKDMIVRYLKASGKAFIAEPNRPIARPFFEQLEDAGFSYKQFKQRIVHANVEHLISIYEIN